jgi:hypothetical protein
MKGITQITTQNIVHHGKKIPKTGSHIFGYANGSKMREPARNIIDYFTLFLIGTT